MSYYWTPVCTSCGDDGPKIRSGHSGLKFGPEHTTSSDALKQWLDDHEHHVVLLVGEGMVADDVVRRLGGGRRESQGDVVLRSQDASSSAQNRLAVDGWSPQSDVGIRLSVGPGTRQVIGNSGARPMVLRASAPSPTNRFVFPPGVDEVVVPAHGSAVFVAERPSRWQRLWCRLRGRTPALRWRYQPHDHEKSEGGDPT